MHTDENNAIRYLMKEMDPSEEMEFEKQMREDENLLIEVESLRATQKRLSALSTKNPPQNLTKKISDEAKQLQSEKLRSSKNITFFLKRGLAAAILLAAFTGGGYYLYSGVDVSDSGNSTKSPTEAVEPWVDRNEVLRFSETQQVSQTSAVENDLTRSYDKLELVSDPSGNIGGGSGIMLTGSSN